MWHCNNTILLFSVHFICYLSTCKLNNPDVNHKLNTSKTKETTKHLKQVIAQNMLYLKIYNNNNSIEITEIIIKIQEKHIYIHK
jgi:predicted nucleic acid-binding protein